MRVFSLAVITLLSIGLPYSYAEKILVMINSADTDDIITSGRRHEYSFSGGEKCSLELTQNGNLEVSSYHLVYREWDLAWQSNSMKDNSAGTSFYLHLQKRTGNLVIYQGKHDTSDDRQPIWSSETINDGVNKLYINHNCILTLEENDGTVEWRTTALTRHPTLVPSFNPSYLPSLLPSRIPSSIPSHRPTSIPSSVPSLAPSFSPSSAPSSELSNLPSSIPSIQPSIVPSYIPSLVPSVSPSIFPTSSAPTLNPSLNSSSIPSSSPTNSPPKVFILTSSSNPYIAIPSGRKFHYFFGDMIDANECSLELTNDGKLVVKSLRSAASKSSLSNESLEIIWESQSNKNTPGSYLLYLKKNPADLVIYKGFPTMSDIDIETWSLGIDSIENLSLFMDNSCTLTLEDDNGYIEWSSVGSDIGRIIDKYDSSLVHNKTRSTGGSTDIVDENPLVEAN